MIYDKDIFVIAAAYALGCISTGYYLTRLRTGKDIRQAGSGSTGARNVSRMLGRRWSVLTLAVDFFKGAGAAGLGLWIAGDAWVVSACVLAVVAGHIWPVQLGFRGGKGVSAMFGGLAVMDIRLALAVVVIFGALYLLTHRYIVSGMTAIVMLPVAAVFLDYRPKGMSALVVLTAVVVFAHRSNIQEAIHQGRAKAGAVFGSGKQGQ